MTQNSNEEWNQSKPSNFNSGLIGRIVENWLTSATERSYQIPFCQLLAAEGEELLYIATHGPFEKGKDVITRVPGAGIRAYQLKRGDIKLAEWRSIENQINNLVELPVNLPQCSAGSWHEPFFVTNGRIDDVVLDYVNTANIGWKLRQFPHQLATIEKAQLIQRFLSAHGAYLPQETTDFQDFLDLLRGDGTGPLAKNKLSHFLENVIRLADGTSKLDVSRSLASAVLLTSYVLGSAEKASNHWAVLEGWTIVASYILAAATKFSLSEEYWEESFDLALLGANRALDDLVGECKTRAQFVEGSPIVDGFFYGSRQLVLAGLLSAWSLRNRLAGLDGDLQVQRLILARIREQFVWGESAAPYVLISALELEQQCHSFPAEEVVQGYLHMLLWCHGEGMRGLPDIFIDIEDAIRFMYRIGEQDVESFQGFSYSIQAVVDFLARRWRRRALSLSWESISRLSLDSSIPTKPWEWFFWRSNSSELQSTIAGQPQSWSALLQEAENRDFSSLPSLLLKNPVFLLLFLLVFPHRLTLSTFAALDQALMAW